MENELVDLIDELLERDAGTVNSTIIGELFRRYIPKVIKIKLKNVLTTCGFVILFIFLFYFNFLSWALWR